MLDYELIGEHLRQIRDSAHMSQLEVADYLGITPSALSQYEKGKRRIEALQLEKLSHLYGVTLGAFFGRREPKADWEETLRSMSQSLSAANKAGIAYLIQQIKNFENLFKITDLSFPGIPHPPFAALGEEVFADYEVEEYAHKARNFFNLGSAPLRDLKSFLESQGYHVFAAPFGQANTDISGLFFMHPELGPIIAFNENQSYGRAIFTMIHEMAHSLFHYNRPTILCRSTDSRNVEFFAERFAAYFLMPGEALHEQLKLLNIKTVSTPEELVHLSRYFGVSYRAMKRRLERENQLRPSCNLDDVKPIRLARSLGYQPTRYEYGIRPLPLEMQFPRMSLALTHRAIAQELISEARAAEMLGLSDLELEEYFHGIETEEGELASDDYA
jgi:Zn-dependent peptidase ImmA (M78 family)/transcriptional regulator with XRE-family HTH domain